MIRNEVAFGLGIAVGVIVAGTVAYICYKKIKEENAEKDTARKEFSDILKEKSSHSKNINDLLTEMASVDVLTVQDLTNWYRDHLSEYPKGTKMIVALPTENVLKGLGYSTDTKKIDPEKNIIQLLYDDDRSKTLLVRLIQFNNIDSNLQAHLIEEDGMIVVTAED